MSETARAWKGPARRAAAYLPSLVALLVIIFAGLFAERQSRALAVTYERGAVNDRIQLLAAGLQRAMGHDPDRVQRVFQNARGASDVESAAALVATAGLADRAVGLELALVGANERATALDDPVLVPLVLPGADVTLAGTPTDGWSDRSAAVWPIRIVTLVAVGLIVGPMLRTRRLVGERQRNINELRDREVELDRLSRRLGLALDASKVGVWDYAIDDDELVWDERMDELYGYAPNRRRHTYEHWRSRLHPDDLAKAEAEFREAIDVTGRYVSEYRLVMPWGVVRRIRAIGKVYRELDGRSRIIGVNLDVTADVARSEELDARRLEAEDASVAKSEFLATMSHEIRTPMNGVIGMLDLMLRTELDAAQRERALIAADSARQLLCILNDILDLSKLEANRIVLACEPVDVSGLVRDVAALMGASAVGRDLAVRSEVGPGVPLRLLADAARLRQILTNLVGNAVKFTESGSVDAMVDYDAAQGRVVFAVRDTGIGISEAARQTLFQRFSQVDSAANRLRGGTGLGLAICRQIVELMGGEISVDSVPGLGSTFRFWVPAAVADAASEGAAAPAPAAAVPSMPPAHVLVAEDNSTNRHILAAYLSMTGHTAVMVTDGQAALDAVEREHFDIILMDIQMPGMDGLAAAGRIRALGGPRSAIPIIALTANAMQGDREECLAAGMSDYVAKPLSLDALCAAMARCLAGAEDRDDAVSTLRPRHGPGAGPTAGKTPGFPVAGLAQPPAA